jgi:TonB-linked SusC/RagA family outer membrane protein
MRKIYEYGKRLCVLKIPCSQVLMLLLASALLLNVVSANAQTAKKITVTGTVTDTSGVAFRGVGIASADKKTSTVTDINGRFIIDVPSGTVLTISFVGFIPQQLTVTDQNKSLKIILIEQITTLGDEIVITAYSRKQTREALVGSVTTVKPGNLRTPASNLTNALAGQVAGIIAYQPSGQPGQDNSQFFIRGVTTFGYKQDPLILIDNVELTPSDLARLNVDDIESFSILKDASATALYGARGGNGVILVKTKEGRVGKAQINARFENRFSQSLEDLHIADPITYMQLFNEATITRDATKPIPYTANKITNTINTINQGPGNNQYVYPAVNWKDMLFKKRTSNQAGNLSISGGGGVARYYVAGSFSKDNGILREDIRNNTDNNIKFQNYQLRSNINIDLSKTTELIARLSGTFNDFTGPRTSDGSFSTDLYRLVMHTSPVDFPAYYPNVGADAFTDHILFGNQPGLGGDADGTLRYKNPYAALLSGNQNYAESRMQAQLELNQKLDFLTEGLNFHGIFSTNRYSFYRAEKFYRPFFYNSTNYSRQNNSYDLVWLNNRTSDQPGFAHEYLDYFRDGYADNIQTFVYLQGVVDYSKTIGEKHNISAALIGTRQQQLFSNNKDPKLKDQSQEDQLTLPYSLPYRNLTLAGRATYSFNRRYFLEANFGYNGSERFNEDHRFGFFPTIGGSWIVSEEKFYGSLAKVIDRLKLRASYGLVGNDAIGQQRFFYISDVNLNGGNPAYFGIDNTNYRGGVSIRSYQNNNVTWETSKQLNFGLEFTVLKKFNVIAEVFQNDKYNILQNRSQNTSLPSTVGLEADIAANIGKVRSKGMDISFDGNHSFNKDLSINARANFTYSTNAFTKFEEPSYPEAYRTRINQPINRNFGYIAERLFVDDYEAANSPRQVFSTNGRAPKGGDIKYRDLNGDGIINLADQAPIGNTTIPEIVYGFGFSMNYKNFDFSTFLQGQANVSFFIDPSRVSPFQQSPDYQSYTGGQNTIVAGLCR